jgi:hypothetical protein
MMLVIFKTAPPVFVRITFCGALVVLTIWLAKVKLGGRNATAGAEDPLPASRIVSGESAALSVIVTEPKRLPATVGVKVTLMMQLAPAATLAPQVLV